MISEQKNDIEGDLEFLEGLLSGLKAVKNGDFSKFKEFKFDEKDI